MEEMISVIVPIYMGEQWLARCIEAIRKQSFRNIEIILVNDGSPDGSGKICDEFAAIDSRIRIVNKENGGLSDARNAGITAATGAYIMFVDEDDYIHPDMATILYQTLKKTDADIVVCDFLPVSDTETPEYPAITQLSEPVCFEGEEIMNQLYYRNLLTVVAWNKLYRKEVFAKHAYIKGRVHDDESAIHFILNDCRKTAYIKEKLYYYVQREGSITSNRKWNYYSDGWQAYEERLAFLQDHGYGQMVVWTKLHMLHYICKNYEKLKQNQEVAEWLLMWRKRFSVLYDELLEAEALSEEQKQLYKYFVISPKLYYNKKVKTEKRVKRINRMKGIMKKLLRK